MPRHQEIGSDQATTGADQTLDERSADPERWVRHHLECAARKAEVGRVGTDDRHIVSVELMPQVRGSPRVQLERHNPRTGGHERAGDRSGSGTDVEDKVTWDDAGVGDESFRPATIELVPPPPRRAARGHGGPSP